MYHLAVSMKYSMYTFWSEKQLKKTGILKVIMGLYKKIKNRIVRIKSNNIESAKYNTIHDTLAASTSSLLFQQWMFHTHTEKIVAHY